MTHPSVEHFTRAMQFKGLAPCPQDSRWEIPTDSDICTEVETLQLLFGFVRTLKPALVVETGTNVGCATAVIAAALSANGGGFVASTDIDVDVLTCAKQRLNNNSYPGVSFYWDGYGGLELVKRFPDTDLYWIDSSDSSRMAELHWIRDHGKRGAVILTHDTNLIGHVTEVHRTLPNWVLLPGPRGLGIATL